MPPAAIVDAHVHLWDPARIRIPWLDGDDLLGRPYGPAEYRAHTAGSDVAAFIYVQVDVAPAYGLTEARLMVGRDPTFFDLDRAAEEVAERLGPPRVHRRRDVLRVTEAAPLVAYVRSLLPEGVRTRELAELSAHVEREIERAGAISIGVAVGAVEVRR